MSIMIVGGDSLGSIEKNVKELGFDDIKHLTGRKKSKFRNLYLSQEIDLVLVMTDYINHAVMKKVKKAVKSQDLNVVYAKRSWASIYKKLKLKGLINQSSKSLAL